MIVFPLYYVPQFSPLKAMVAIAEPVAWGCSFKKVFLEIPPDLHLYEKQTPAQMCASEFCKNFKNTFLVKHPWATGFILAKETLV